MIKYYSVFSIDVSFETYSIDNILVGAENVKDLLKNLHLLEDGKTSSSRHYICISFI